MGGRGNRRYRGLVAGALALMLAPATAFAWPDKPVRVYTSLPAGTTVDLIARLVAGHLADRLKQPFVVENKAGAQGLIAAKQVAAAPPDGYTLLVAGSISALDATLKEGFGISKEFAYISLLRKSPTFLGVSTKRPFKSLRELIDYGKANPKKLNYGSIARTLELYTATINAAAGVDAVHVPFRGTADALNALGIGDIDYYLDAPSAFEPLVQQGLARVLASTSAKRTPDRPDIPSLADAGLTGLDLVITYGLVAPKGTPDEIVKILGDGVREFAARPDIVEKYLAMGQGIPPWTTPAEYRAQVAEEIVTYQNAAKLIGFEPQ